MLIPQGQNDKNTKHLKDKSSAKAEVSSRDFAGCQGGGEGVNKTLMTEADNAHSRKSTIQATALSQKGKETTPLTHSLIIGDNYPALLNLLISYREKIKVIYIDPPYGKDDLGQFADTNYHNAITRDNLLSMLYPRLQLAKQLLREDGVIFCSIDDRNQAYVKCLFDEVFGEGNFIETFLWNKTQTPPSASHKTRKTHEFILCYQKIKDNQKMIARFSDGGDAPLWNETNSERILTFPANYVDSNLKDGIYQKGIRDKIELLDDVEVKNGKILNTFRLKGHFRWKQETLEQEINDNVYLVVKSDKFSIRYCRDGERIVMPTNEISKKDNVGTNETASSELQDIMSNKVFQFNKPVSLIKYLVSLISHTHENNHIQNDKVDCHEFANANADHEATASANDEGNCHTEPLGEVSQDSKGDISAFSKPQYDKVNFVIASETKQSTKIKIQSVDCHEKSSDFSRNDENFNAKSETQRVKYFLTESAKHKEAKNGALQGEARELPEVETHAKMKQSPFLAQKTSPDKEQDIILDFFAGSGTTAHAVLELNREDGGNRKFILVTNNEITPLNPKGIAQDVTSKRLKRIMSGECYDGDKSFKWLEKNEPYGDNLEVCEIESCTAFDEGIFSKIDERLYGLEKFTNPNEKIKWVCENFERVMKKLVMSQKRDDENIELDEEGYEKALRKILRGENDSKCD